MAMPLTRGLAYCNEQKANSKAFDKGFDHIKWDEESKLEEIGKETSNHPGLMFRHFKVKES